MRSDARALLPQWLLGDLDDNFLPFLEQVADGRLPLVRTGTAGTGNVGTGNSALRLALGFRASFRARFRTAFRAATLRTSVLPAILPPTPAAACTAGNAVRIPPALFPNHGGAGFRFRGALPRFGPFLVSRTFFRGSLN